jgi:Fur family peroxide stress response transcriptional regulator
MNSLDTLTKSLKQAGLRITSQRVAICRMLGETHSHPTAAVIYEEIHKQYPSLSLATVYNTLDALVGLGMVNVLGAAGDGRVHFDADTNPHINLACTSCHRIFDLPSDELANMESVISLRSGFKLRGARIMYYGLCPDCQIEVD